MDKSKHDLVLTGNLQQNVTRSKLNTNLYQQIFKSTIKHGRPKSKHPLVYSSPPPILLCDKTFRVLFRIIRGIIFISPSSTRMAQAG